MIIQALNNYYNRLKGKDDIALYGFSPQKFCFAIVLNKQGECVQIDDLHEIQIKNLGPKVLIVPKKIEERAGAAIVPHFMWDNTTYVLGRDNKGTPERALKAFEAFRELHHEIGDGIDDEGMKALLRFLDAWDPADAPEMEHWNEIAGLNIVFQLDGDLKYMHERETIQDAWLKHVKETEVEIVKMCLVSGEYTTIARLHPAIKGVKGAKSKGASIVSFNIDSAVSYGKTQGFNAPVSNKITFAYTTALNYLLRFKSNQKVQIGDATTAFWTERESAIEGFMGVVLSPTVDKDGDLKEVRDFLEAVRDGNSIPEVEEDKDVKFFILSLSPNSARISVRFWNMSTVKEVIEKLRQHFDDLSIVKEYENNPEFPGVWQILRETAAQGKLKNINPLLSGALIRAILMGGLYPQTLLSSVITRIRADKKINYLRAAIIKACITRNNRIHNRVTEVGVDLNTEITSVGYKLGRLFALLEKAQRDAIPGAKATIRDRLFSSAATTPRAIFPRLLKLGQHHIKKAKFGMLIDRDIESVMKDIAEFPVHLNLEEQGLFILGYYHQRNIQFQKKPKETQ